jgi:hypothetical protein
MCSAIELYEGVIVAEHGQTKQPLADALWIRIDKPEHVLASLEQSVCHDTCVTTGPNNDHRQRIHASIISSAA